MTLKAALFGFRGVIVRDEGIHQRLIADILLQENLRFDAKEYRQCCFGRSDRACLSCILSRRGRAPSASYLTRLINYKADAYAQEMNRLESCPIYADVKPTLIRLQEAGMMLAIVSGATQSEIELILTRADLANFFSVIVADDELSQSKPDSTGYLQGMETLSQACPSILSAANCVVIEDSCAGLQAAKAAQLCTVGVANSCPLHIIQRQANWAVDCLTDLELERLCASFAGELAPSEEVLEYGSEKGGN